MANHGREKFEIARKIRFKSNYYTKLKKFLDKLINQKDNKLNIKIIKVLLRTYQ